MNYEARIHIDASADIVWATLSDVERWPEWTGSVRAVDLLSRRLTKRYVAMEVDGLKNEAESIQRFRAEPREVW